ncbi:MAG: sugar phosphate isomerase/epimerase [Planctomycetota bacterium]
MKIGALTAPFGRGWPLERIITWAGENGIDCLEVATPAHLDPAKLLAEDGAAAVNKKLDAAGVSISSLAAYSTEINDPDPPVRKKAGDALLAAVRAAEALGVDTVCCLAGMPLPGKSKLETIRGDLPGVFGPILDEAGKRGVRIALENWYPTNMQHLDLWRAAFEAMPQENLGLNFDPSHLAWQEIDYIAAVGEFAGRIFHTHAKDVAIDDAVLRRVGVLEGGWWRYTIPGTGRIAWGEYLGKLRQVGFDGAVSIEHEDGTFGAEEGFIIGANFLRALIG